VYQQFMAVAHAVSPYISAYSWSSSPLAAQLPAAFLCPLAFLSLSLMTSSSDCAALLLANSILVPSGRTIAATRSPTTSAAALALVARDWIDRGRVTSPSSPAARASQVFRVRRPRALW
jgi:hypothetical protein